jgi:hypothetical protein
MSGFLMKEETLPEAFLNGAKGYCEAANLLLDQSSKIEANLLLRDPIYMLYCHATELSLKAFLRHKGLRTASLKTKFGHHLAGLHSQCTKVGLVIPKEFALDLVNVTSLLDSGNSDSAFRYWNPKSTVVPSLDWTKKVVIKLIELVETYVPSDQKPGKAVKFIITAGEPEPQKRAAQVRVKKT